MNDEIKQLIEDAARLIGLEIDKSETSGGGRGNTGFDLLGRAVLDWHSGEVFDPLDPERGDLMKVAMAAGLIINFENGLVASYAIPSVLFTKGDHDSLALAVLRAASAVLKERGEA